MNFVIYKIFRSDNIVSNKTHIKEKLLDLRFHEIDNEIDTFHKITFKC